jgi:hypothetical protein
MEMCATPDTKLKCNQKDCVHDAVYRYTWPGHDEAGICELHRAKAQAIANAIGMHLQFIRLDSSISIGGQ